MDMQVGMVCISTEEYANLIITKERFDVLVCRVCDIEDANKSLRDANDVYNQRLDKVDEYMAEHTWVRDSFNKWLLDTVLKESNSDSSDVPF